MWTSKTPWRTAELGQPSPAQRRVAPRRRRKRDVRRTPRHCCLATSEDAAAANGRMRVPTGAMASLLCCGAASAPAAPCAAAAAVAAATGAVAGGTAHAVAARGTAGHRDSCLAPTGCCQLCTPHSAAVVLHTRECRIGCPIQAWLTGVPTPSPMDHPPERADLSPPGRSYTDNNIDSCHTSRSHGPR